SSVRARLAGRRPRGGSRRGGFPRETRHLTAPFEVGDDVGGRGLAVPAVLRLEPVAEVLALRDGKKRRVPPPPRPGGPAGLRERGEPPPGTARGLPRGAGPAAGAAGAALGPHGRGPRGGPRP